MDRIEVRAVQGEAELQAWIQLPRRTIYPPASPWVPPLDRDLRRMLDRRQNPFFRHGVALPLLALDQRGAPVGRALAHIYHRHNVRHGERAAFFGFFECVDDRQVARALIDAAAAFGAQHGCTVLRGPFNLTAMQEMGILLDGFATPPVVDETYTAPYYPALIEATGLRPVFPVTTFRIDDLGRVEPDALLGARHRDLLAEGRLRLRAANLKEWDRELETLRELLNDSFQDNPHFVPITADEFVFQVGPYRRLMDPAIGLVAELDGVPCAFAITVPDFNPLLKRMRGRLGPGSLLAFLRGRSEIHDAVLIIMGVQRQLQGRGIMRLLQAELVRALRRRGYRRLTITWIAEANHLSRATVTALGARPLHRLTLYESLLPLSVAISAATPSAARDAWLRGARAAPSAHNTQPWRFVPRPDGSVLVRWDPERTLPAADPTNRDLYLALGAAIESARLKSAAAGLPLTFVPAADGEERTVGFLQPTADPVEAADLELAGAIDRRRTARVPHLIRPLPTGLVATLQASAEGADCRLHLLVARPAVQHLARLAARATAAQFADPLIQAELWRWLRLDPLAREYQRDGLTAACLELRGPALTVARLVLPPARMRQVVRLGGHHPLALDTQRLVGRSTALCLLTAPSDRRADLVQSGRALLRLWLIATTAGLTTQPVSALLDCAQTIGPAVAAFGARGEAPAALFRLGAAPPVARAPRLPADELLEAAGEPEHLR